MERFPFERAEPRGVDMKRNYSFLIIVLSVVLCAGGIGLFELGRVDYWDHEHKNGTFWGKLVSLPPNQIGDFLAGVFSSLAFIAAIAALWFQRSELELTRDELKKSANTLGSQVTILKQRAPRFLTILAGAQRCVWREAGGKQSVGVPVPRDGHGTAPFTPCFSGLAT